MYVDGLDNSYLSTCMWCLLYSGIYVWYFIQVLIELGNWPGFEIIHDSREFILKVGMHSE